MSNTPSVTTVENSGNSDMDRLMKEMQSLHERTESEMNSYKSKCTTMETVIESIKKIVQMDKLQSNFDAYKLEMKKQIEILENDKKVLQNKINTCARELQHEKARSRELALENARWKTTEVSLKKKITNLTHTLEAEKSISKTKIDKLTNELNLALLKPKQQKVTVEVPKVDSKLTKERNSKNAITGDGKLMEALHAYRAANATINDPVKPKDENDEMMSSSLNATVVVTAASIISTQVSEKEEILSAPLISTPKTNGTRGRKRKSMYAF